MKPLGLPYKGSKRNLAHWILQNIFCEFPQGKYFVDLFGGGGALSAYALKNRLFERVFYNEIQSDIADVFKYSCDGTIQNRVDLYRFYNREEFKEIIKTNTLQGGVAKLLFSFGCNLRSYLYQDSRALMKHKTHKILAGDFTDIEELNSVAPRVDFKALLSKENSIETNRRLMIKALGEAYGTKADIVNFLNVEHLFRVNSLLNLKTANTRLEVSSLDYVDFNITTPIEETIIYCDPPYKNTEAYGNKFDNDKFIEWVKACPYKVFVSEYQEFDGLQTIAKIKRVERIDANNNTKYVTEYLLSN